MTPAERLDLYISEGRLIRRKWFDGGGSAIEGYARACLLVALAPQCAGGNPSLCPAAVMPEWLAHLTPWIDDSGTELAWPALIRRYAALAHRWHVLSSAAWQRLEFKVKRAIVIEARGHVPESNAVLPSIDNVISLLDRATKGDLPSNADWESAKSAAKSAWSAAKSAESAAESAASAWSAESAAESAWSAAESAWSAWSAESAAESAWSAAESAASAREQACDRMHTTILDLLEEEIVTAEAA